MDKIIKKSTGITRTPVLREDRILATPIPLEVLAQLLFQTSILRILSLVPFLVR